ncbi:glycosyltransferase family 4 protein [Candidatus Woesearchaeota archaeon]|nr:glycosyltransferase family 4 protein [Candidatus Woesearchaeota archaeon]
MNDKKKIKVYLQYPWRFPDSPYYKYLVENPPKDIIYLNTENQKGVITNKKKFFLSNFLKKIIRKTMNSLNISIPNAHLSPEGDYDIIHCCHCISKNKNKPWIMDIESEWQLYIGNKTKKSKERVKKILLKENCKKILAWTKETANQIIKEFPEIKNKIEVIYPAVPLYKKGNDKKDGKVTIFYATRYFWIKGGYIALEVFRRLKEEYKEKVNLIFISDVPKKIKRKYPDIEIKNLISNKKIIEYYKNSDIFFYPSFMDTFGFGQLEAMSFGLPIITIKTFYTKTKKEIIKNNKDGFIINVPDDVTLKNIKLKEKNIINKKEEKIINELFSKLRLLIENKKLREEMSKNCLEKIKRGKFSINKRNKQLKKIYEEVLR